MRKILLLSLLSIGFLAGCVMGTPTSPTLDSSPSFVSAKDNFRWYNAHMAGDRFELLKDEDGNTFVMTYAETANSMLLPLMFVSVNNSFGLMLDENLCSNGLGVMRQGNRNRYNVNVTPSWDKNLRKEVPVGICFEKI